MSDGQPMGGGATGAGEPSSSTPGEPSSSLEGRWLKCMMARPAPRRRLLCLPYAGGSAQTFRRWSAHLPAHVEVWSACLPGHVGRLAEPLATDLHVVADAIATELLAKRPLPVVLYGHSMGAWLALEVARRMHRRGPAPAGLIVSGRSGPGYPTDGSRISGLSDAEFVRALRTRYGGLSDEVVASAEIMELFLPVLRADIGMMERYDPTAGGSLSCPIVAVGGTDDPATPIGGLERWRAVTSGPFETRLFKGGHFFLDSAADSLLAALSATLDALP